MPDRLSRFSPEELAGLVLLVLAIVALAVNTGAIERSVATLAGSPSGPVRALDIARDTEDERMRFVLARARAPTVEIIVRDVVIVGEPCVAAGPIGSDRVVTVVCARPGWPLTPR